MAIKSTLVIEDFTALGQISMVTATTILQAMGNQTALLPTGLLSTQTEGFHQPVHLATDHWIDQAMDHWQATGVNFGGAVVGYLGTVTMVQKIGSLLNRQPLSLTVVDPVMADQGELYPGLSAEYPMALRQLCQQATVITPNWTELCLLAGERVQQPSPLACTKLVSKLRQQDINAAVVVTGVEDGEQVGNWLLQDHQLQWLAYPRYPGHFYGTGDTFAALLYGYLSQGKPLIAAAKMAGDALAQAVAETSALTANERRYGMKLKKLLAYLALEGEQIEESGNH